MKRKVLSPQIKRMLGLDPFSQMRNAIESRMASELEIRKFLARCLKTAKE